MAFSLGPSGTTGIDLSQSAITRRGHTIVHAIAAGRSQTSGFSAGEIRTLAADMMNDEPKSDNAKADYEKLAEWTEKKFEAMVRKI